MRFGAALELWHKGELHANEPAAAAPAAEAPSPKAVAAKLTAGVAAGRAVEIAQGLAETPDDRRDAIWACFDEKTQAALTAVWPA